MAQGERWDIELDEQVEWAIGKIAGGMTHLRFIEACRLKWECGRAAAERTWEAALGLVSAGVGEEARKQAVASYEALLERLRDMEADAGNVDERRKLVAEQRMVLAARDRVMGLNDGAGPKEEMGSLGQLIADQMSEGG